MEEWQLLRKVSNRKTLGTVWLIERGEEKGYFKFASSKSQNYIGPLAATELIVYRLATKLNLPAAKVKLVRVGTQLGAVSLIKPVKNLYHWRQLNSRIIQSIPDYIIDPDRLLKSFVFDIWICNFDRHGGNIIVYPVGEKYDFYLIDHGLSLTGVLQRTKFPWDHPFWDQKASFKHFYLKGTRNYIKSYDQLEPFIKEVQSLGEKNIDGVIDSIPESILSSETGTIMKKLLIHRQQKLPELVKRLL